MDASSAKKLTKRERKASTFRSKNKKRKLEHALNIPVSDDDLSEERDQKNISIADSGENVIRDAAVTEETNDHGWQTHNALRKKCKEVHQQAVAQEPIEDNDTVSSEKSIPSDQVDTQKRLKRASRFIVFIGNLPYNTTKDQIEKHFEPAGGILSIRLITDKQTKKPKGFAFLEFENSECLNKALHFHHTLFQKRRINVELTAGGGGSKSEMRMAKVKRKNTRLEEERRQLHKQRALPKSAEFSSKNSRRKKRRQTVTSTNKRAAATRRPASVSAVNSIQIDNRSRVATKV